MMTDSPPRSSGKQQWAYSGLPLNALRAFDLAAQKGSFAEAAKILGVTPAAVSQLIKRLERHLGVALFTRLNRRVELTKNGQILAGDVQIGMSWLEQAVRDMRRIP